MRDLQNRLRLPFELPPKENPNIHCIRTQTSGSKRREQQVKIFLRLLAFIIHCYSAVEMWLNSKLLTLPIRKIKKLQVKKQLLLSDIDLKAAQLCLRAILESENYPYMCLQVFGDTFHIPVC